MAESKDKPPVMIGDQSSADEESVNAPQHLDPDVPQLQVNDEDDPASQELLDFAPAGSARPLSQELQEEGSELGSVNASSVDAPPRRAGSPIDSILSGPDDTPSVQVWCALNVGNQRLCGFLTDSRVPSYPLQEAAFSHQLLYDPGTVALPRPTNHSIAVLRHASPLLHRAYIARVPDLRHCSLQRSLPQRFFLHTAGMLLSAPISSSTRRTPKPRARRGRLSVGQD